MKIEIVDSCPFEESKVKYRLRVNGMEYPFPDEASAEAFCKALGREFEYVHEFTQRLTQ